MESLGVHRLTLTSLLSTQRKHRLLSHIVVAAAKGTPLGCVFGSDKS